VTLFFVSFVTFVIFAFAVSPCGSTAVNIDGHVPIHRLTLVP
jgi:hypothetical protein